MPKTDTTGGHHTFQDMMTKYRDGIENLVYAAEVECGENIGNECKKIMLANPCPFRTSIKLKGGYLGEVEEISAVCDLHEIRSIIGPQKICTEIH